VTSCLKAVPPREAEVAQVLTEADAFLLRMRPELMRGKYERMAGNPFDFYRGTLPLFRRDWELGRASRSHFAAGARPVWGLGDPHPENFGVLVGADLQASLEANDFDGADRVPALFDVRRLVAGLAIGAKQANPAASVETIAGEAARAYAEALVALAAGAEAERISDAAGLGVAGLELSGARLAKSAILEDLFRRSARDAAKRAELGQLTVVEGQERRFRRGVLDPADPTEQLADVPDFVRAAVPELLRRLGTAPAWTVKDVVRKFGGGVASWPRARFLVLVQGPKDSPEDDLVLELKELAESALAGWYAPALAGQDTPSRVEAASRRAWLRGSGDPHWYNGAWLGFPFQVRTESEANKSVRVSRWTGARASEEELVRLAQVLGALLARVHARSEADVVASVAKAVGGDVTAFSAEQASFALEALASNQDDLGHFQRALEMLGPTLGVGPDAGERPTGLVQAFFGSPP
jgi:uncharacterized protein (DUF2252 family)